MAGINISRVAAATVTSLYHKERYKRDGGDARKTRRSDANLVSCCTLEGVYRDSTPAGRACGWAFERHTTSWRGRADVRTVKNEKAERSASSAAGASNQPLHAAVTSAITG